LYPRKNQWFIENPQSFVGTSISSIFSLYVVQHLVNGLALLGYEIINNLIPLVNNTPFIINKKE